MDIRSGLAMLSQFGGDKALEGVKAVSGPGLDLQGFADKLRHAMGDGGLDANLLMGGQFMGIMDGGAMDARSAKELSGLSDMQSMMDALLGDGGGSGGGLMPGLPGMGGQGDLFMNILRSQAREAQAVQEAGAATAPRQALSADDPGATLAEPSGTTQAASRTQNAMGTQDAAGTRAAEAASAPTAPRPLQNSVPVGVPLQVMDKTAQIPGQQSQSLAAARKAMAAKVYGAQEDRSGLGRLLASRFESGGDPGAVGWDRTGGTSYGIYQLSSKTGTFDHFLDFLDGQAPDMAAVLRSAGAADTGSKTGPAPAAWKALAASRPKEFEDLQHRFVSATHFAPAARKVAELTGLDISGLSPALSEVLFSTAVQHGATGGAKLFARAVAKAGGLDGILAGDGFGQTLINELYKDRAMQFGSSSRTVRKAVQSRLAREMREALKLLSTTAKRLDTSA